MSIASIITRYWSLELCKELKKWKKKWKGAEERHHCKYQRKATAQRNAALKKSDFNESSPTLQPAIQSCESGQRMPLLKAAN